MADTFGPAIARGSALWPAEQERPAWLRSEERTDVRWDNSWYSRGDVNDLSRVDCVSGWPKVTAIRLPADHPASIAQRWNDEHPDQPPFTRIWHGGDAAPEDWDGGLMLHRAGHSSMRSGRPLPDFWRHESLVALQDSDIIAYRHRDTVTEQPRETITGSATWGGNLAPLPTYDPTTHVAVPLEPTVAIIQAMRGRSTIADCGTDQGARDIYSNIVHAAGKPDPRIADLAAALPNLTDNERADILRRNDERAA